MAAQPNGPEDWVGSAYLFVESTLDKVALSDAYAHPQQKVAVYQALQTALTGTWVLALEKELPGASVEGPGAETHLFTSVGYTSPHIRRKI